MFEDFENRMGFWKNLGSNFTIQYSGDAPSFMTDSEMWQSMDSGTTQTLAAWENGWVLTNNPDGTITANPKYTSGLPSETLTKVPIGFAPPTNTTPTDAGGGVVVAFNNEENNSTEDELGLGGGGGIPTQEATKEEEMFIMGGMLAFSVLIGGITLLQYLGERKS